MEIINFLNSIKNSKEDKYYVVDIKNVKGLQITENGNLYSIRLSSNTKSIPMLLKLTLDGEERYYFKSVYTNGDIKLQNSLELDCESILYGFNINTIELNSPNSIEKTRDRLDLLDNPLNISIYDIELLDSLGTEDKIEIERINNAPNELINILSIIKKEASNILKEGINSNKTLIKK